jgi:integrase/recombinase XerD
MATTTKNQRTISVLEQETNLHTWAEAFLVDRKVGGCSPGTLSFYREKLTKFLDYCEAQVITNVLEITPNFIRQYLLYLDDVGHNPGGVHAHFRTLRTFLNWWEDEFEPDAWKNPICKVKAPKLAIQPLEPVELDVVRAMLHTCERGTFFGVRDKAILLALLDTGVRAQEFININIDDVDTVRGAILIRQGKGGKPRTVFLGNKSRKALRTYLRSRQDNSTALWVSKRNERLTYWGLRQIIRRRAEKAVVEEPSLHSFRRYFAITMLRNGTDLVTLSRLLGHTDLQVLERYLKQIPDDLQEAHQNSGPVDNLKF